MGSLMPGWDANHLGVPRELQEHKNHDEPEGYFERLEKTKTLRRTSQELASASEHGPLRRAQSARVPDVLDIPARHGPPALPSGHIGGAGSPPLAHTGSVHVSAKYKLTDWSSEFPSLRPPGSKPGCQSAELYSSAGGGLHERKSEPLCWWSELDTGALNTPAEPPPGSDRNRDRAAGRHPPPDAEEGGHRRRGEKDLGKQSVRLDFSLTGTHLGESLL